MRQPALGTAVFAVGVLAMVFGQALVLGSRRVLVYGVCLALGFHLFVLGYEEPTLSAQFGAEYLAYRRRVRRWLPRCPTFQPPADQDSSAVVRHP